MSKYEAVYFVGDNQASNRIRVDSYKTRNRGAFSGSLAALLRSRFYFATIAYHVELNADLRWPQASSQCPRKIDV